MAQALGPIFDPGFSDSSFGFRPGRSAHGALRRIQTHIADGYRIAVDLDLAKFFDTVQHDILMARVGRKVRDKRLLALIGEYLRAGVRVGDTLEATVIGTPQGGPCRPCWPISFWMTWTRNSGRFMGAYKAPIGVAHAFLVGARVVLGKQVQTQRHMAAAGQRRHWDLRLLAYSGARLPLIPRQACHPFQGKAATDSTARLPPRQRR
ncbi:reverse transcriptase domain-containing protein [Ectothiorhodospira haloalkaliphila]|nr:reverse transcriptase domain-containing protein [Ectothiorhodospira haloalkaliphila]